MKKIQRIIFFVISIILAMTAVVFAETDENVGQLYWVQGETIQDADTGKYRTYSDESLELDSEGKIITSGCLETYNNIKFSFASDGRCGFFAVKEGENYYAVAPVSYANGDESIAKLYQTEGTKHYSIYPCQIGKCSFQAEREGKVYEISCNVSFESTETLNFFQHADPTAKNLITSDIRFCEMAEQNEEGTEVSFYAILEDDLELILWDDTEGTQTTVQGISIESSENTATLDDERFRIWKITLTNEYETSDNPEICFRLRGTSTNGQYYYSSSRFINVYGSDVSPVLYSFSQYYASVHDGKINLSEDAVNNCVSLRPSKNISLDEGDASTLYFAIKLGTEYYVVNDVDALEEGLNVEESGTSGAKSLEAVKTGTYTLDGIYDDVHYEMTVNVSKFSTFGFFNSAERTKENEILSHSFSFDDATEKNDDGTEAYFYIIVEAENNKSDNVSISISGLKTNPWNGHGGIQEKQAVEGISVGTPIEETFDGIRCFVWKVTVTDLFQPNADNSSGKQILFMMENFSYQSGSGISGSSCYIVGKSESEIPGLGKFVGSGGINLADTLFLRRAIAGWSGYEVSIAKADINQDGIVNKLDVIALERHVAGWKEYRTLPYTSKKQV